MRVKVSGMYDTMPDLMKLGILNLGCKKILQYKNEYDEMLYH